MFESIKKICKKAINPKGSRNVQPFGGGCQCGGGTKRPEDAYLSGVGVKNHDNTRQNALGIQRIANTCQMTNMLRRIGK